MTYLFLTTTNLEIMTKAGLIGKHASSFTIMHIKTAFQKSLFHMGNKMQKNISDLSYHVTLLFTYEETIFQQISEMI